MRPRARDKKLNEEWVVPLNGIEDVYEVKFLLTLDHESVINWFDYMLMLENLFRKFSICRSLRNSALAN